MSILLSCLARGVIIYMPEIKNMIKPISESFPEKTLDEILEKANRQQILQSGQGGGVSIVEKDFLYWDFTQGVWLPKCRK